METVKGRNVGWLAPELQEVDRQLRATLKSAQEVAAGLDDVRFNWRPGPGRWSIGECVSHLNIAGSETLPLFDRGIDRARIEGWSSRGSHRLGLIARWVIALTEPPPRLRFKAAARLQPQLDAPVRAAMAAFADLHEQYLARMRAASGLDLRRISVPVPRVRVFRLGMHEYLAYLAAHERRHLWQARRVREDPQFPRGAASPEPGLARPQPRVP